MNLYIYAALFSFETCNNYRPQRSCGQGYVFTRVCDSVHRGGVCLSACREGSTPREGSPPPEGSPPREGSTPPGKEAPPLLPEGSTTPPPGRKHHPSSRKEAPPQHMVNERLVRILLECILVLPVISYGYKI